MSRTIAQIDRKSEQKPNRLLARWLSAPTGGVAASGGSFASLVTGALFVVTLPMLGAVVFSTWNADRQLSESRALVARAVRVTALGESVDDQVSLLQRSARRFNKNGAAAEKKNLHKRQDRLLEVLDDMAKEQPDAAPRQIVRELQNLAQAPIAQATKALGSDAQSRAQSETFSEMRELTDDMRQANRRALTDRLSALAQRNAATRQGLLLGSVLLVLVAIILVALLARLVTHPLSQILVGIRRLGRSQLGDPVAEPIQVSGTAELRQLGRELEWLRNRLRNIEEEKNAFLRQISHDLKTPLTNIKEGGSLLLDGVDSPTRSEQIVLIVHRNALRLESLIAQLLDFTATQNQACAASFERCDLCAIVATRVSEHELQINARNLSIDIQMSGPLLMQGDPQRLARMLDNLLSNAIKFSPVTGEIKLSAGSTASGIVLEISDQGPGFSREDRIRAFDPFYRGASAISGDVPGTGIGLSVAQACARIHGGVIEIAQRDFVAPGSLIRVRLPTAQWGDNHGR